MCWIGYESWYHEHLIKSVLSLVSKRLDEQTLGMTALVADRSSEESKSMTASSAKLSIVNIRSAQTVKNPLTKNQPTDINQIKRVSHCATLSNSHSPERG